jgi:osmoprotectant transport system permease protein
LPRIVTVLALLLGGCAPEAEVVVGSKKFTEGVILGETLAQLARDAGASATHRRELGGTRVVWGALRGGEIDAYVEYTGTLRQEIFAGRQLEGTGALRAALAAEGIAMSGPLGFDNSFALGVREELAQDLGLETVSDLRDHPELRFGFGNEFMDRGDGWPALRDRYRLPQRQVRGMDHDLAYRGLEEGTLDVMDLYTTDAEIEYYGLRTLEDDLGHFPEYQAVILYRRDLAARAPAAVESMLRLVGEIPAPAMVAMNARAKIDRVPEARVAADFLDRRLGVTAEVAVEGSAARFLRLTREHLYLVGVSLAAAILVAIPLGVAAARRPRLGQAILGATGVLQTIPSLALLVFMIPLLGIGAPPAMAALFLYSLLPIVRNTHAGLTGIPPEIRGSAEALGLPPGARLRLVELPMASRSILAGIKTSAVINVGTATLGALIGAGGYGEPILTGIRLDDVGLILQGAVPAAGLALVAQGLFELAERFLVPEGLRLEG